MATPTGTRLVVDGRRVRTRRPDDLTACWAAIVKPFAAAEPPSARGG